MKTENKRLELYIHIPFCVKKCDYCDFLSFPGDGKTQIRYIQTLIEEIRFWGSRVRGYTVPTVYIGGGTPSWLDAELIATVMREVYENFRVEADAEISMECNPGTVTAGKLETYKKAGINRLSIGLQSADNEELKILGRIHTYEKFLKTFELARHAGYDNINIDLMSGIPYQTLDKFLRSLHQVIRLKPEHLSVYSLIVEKGTPFYNRYKFDAVKQQAGLRTEILPNEDEVYRITKATQDILAQSGYQQYEISNFAKPGRACRHNIGYWTRENYLGLGLGSASLIENVRYTNTRDLYDYMYQCERISAKPQEAFASVEQSTVGQHTAVRTTAAKSQAPAGEKTAAGEPQAAAEPQAAEKSAATEPAPQAAGKSAATEPAPQAAEKSAATASQPQEAAGKSAAAASQSQEAAGKSRASAPQPAAPSGLTELTIPDAQPTASEPDDSTDGWFGCSLHTEADIVDRKAQMEEFMFLGLRMNEGVARADFERCFGVPIEAVYLETIGKLRKQDLLVMSEGRLALTDRGMDLANYVMSKFLL